jgi:hypothetical protein
MEIPDEFLSAQRNEQTLERGTMSREQLSGRVKLAARNRALTVSLLVILLACAFSRSYEDANGSIDYEAKVKKEGKRYTRELMRIMYQLKKSACHCDEITYLQSARVTTATGTHRSGNPDFSGRMTKAGWGVDQGTGKIQPWYPQNDDGSYDPGLGFPGNNTNPAGLMDGPGGDNGEWPIKLEFVSCAVCLRGDELCTHRVLYCLYSTFTIDNDGNPTDIDARPANADERKAAADSHDAWNNGVAAGNGKVAIPPLTNFP